MPHLDSHTDMYMRTWDYFSLHANQRMTTFNFFIVLATLEATAVAILIGTNQYTALAPGGVLLGLTLCFTSYVFWKLDQRVSKMIKLAENVLVKIEVESSSKEYQIFTKDREFEEFNKNSSIFKKELWTYGDAHRAIFLMCGIIGIGSSLFIGGKSIIN